MEEGISEKREVQLDFRTTLNDARAGSPKESSFGLTYFLNASRKSSVLPRAQRWVYLA
jgi:hypothetical protein